MNYKRFFYKLCDIITLRWIIGKPLEREILVKAWGKLRYRYIFSLTKELGYSSEELDKYGYPRYMQKEEKKKIIY